MQKAYSVDDLFFTSWAELEPKRHAIVFLLYQELKAMPQEDDGLHPSYGFRLIQILRHLRKNPGLVNKINVEQAVDIFNELKFLNKPWYFFPTLPTAILSQKPDEHMSRHTFDHFIYADNEYSSYLATRDIKYLRRLTVTLYGYPGEEFFDPEDVCDREQAVIHHLKEWQLNLVFFTFAHVREFITKRCRTLLPSAPVIAKEDGEPQEEARVQPTGALWLKLKHRLAETPAFQGYDNAGHARMYSALDYLEDLAQQAAGRKGKV